MYGSTTRQPSTPDERPTRRRWRRLAGIVALASVTAIVPAAPTEAATREWLDVTVAESIPVTGPGEVMSDGGLAAFDCLGADVTTTSLSTRTRGELTRFSGTKDFDCGTGTLSISFRARVRGCATSDYGVWRVTGGTGDFSGARGAGFLVGTYTGGAGNACDSTGIDDRYRGLIRVP